MDISNRNWYTIACQKANMLSQSVEARLEGNKQKKQILLLDGVRAFACLAVLSYHVNFLARNYGIWRPLGGINDIIAAIAYFGESGVVLFFLLSAFLLFLPYAKSLLFDSPWPDFRRFYLRRIFRILPCYYVSLFLIALFFHPEFLQHRHWHDLWLFLTFRMGYALSDQLNGPFWTLAIEFQFYLLLPIIAWFLRPIVRRGSINRRMRNLSCCLFFIFIWGLATRYWGLAIADTTTLDFLIPHAISVMVKPYIYGDTTGKYFEVFAIGMFICMIYTYTQYIPTGKQWQDKFRRISPLLFTAGVVLLLFLSFWHLYYITINPYQYVTYFPILTFLNPYLRQIIFYWRQWQALGYGISYGLCLFTLLYGSPRLKSPFEWPILRWIGMFSFSFYMWHLPLVWLFINVILNNIRSQGWQHFVQLGAFWCWVLVIIVPISVMLYYCVEKPGIRVGEWLIAKLEQPKKPSPNKESEETQPRLKSLALR